MTMGTVERISLAPPRVKLREIVRYSGGGDESLISDCLAEAERVLTYSVCFALTEASVKDGEVDLGFAKVASRGLSKNLCGCKYAAVLAATVGVGIDRLIAKYGRLSPSRAAIMQAIGSERVESLCDAFESELLSRLEACGMEGAALRPRFSPGYGDLSLNLQREIFGFLDPPGRIGVSLGDSLLMTPSKSVTAIIGIGN